MITIIAFNLIWQKMNSYDFIWDSYGMGFVFCVLYEKNLVSGKNWIDQGSNPGPHRVEGYALTTPLHAHLLYWIVYCI